MNREEAEQWLISLKAACEGKAWAKWALEAFDMAIAALREKQQRQPNPDTERVDIAPGFDSIRPEKRAENETTEARHDET